MGIQTELHYEVILMADQSKRPDRIFFDKTFRDQWYYSIELTPGSYTEGFNFSNVALTRKLLSLCEVKGKDCLDISGADGLVSILMSRRGAKRVVATDRYDFSKRFTEINETLSHQIQYFPDTMLSDFTKLPESDQKPMRFDVVINSGLLYHVFDPMSVLACTRTLVKTGGILIVETAIVVENDFSMHFNAHGVFYNDPTSFWFISPSCFEYMLRYFKLKPLCCEYLDVTQLNNGKKVTRMAVACRATDEVVSLDGDQWIKDACLAADYHDIVGLIDNNIANQANVEFKQPNCSQIKHPGTDVCDIWAQFVKHTPLNPSLDQIRLPLNARE